MDPLDLFSCDVEVKIEDFDQEEVETPPPPPPPPPVHPCTFCGRGPSTVYNHTSSSSTSSNNNDEVAKALKLLFHMLGANPAVLPLIDKTLDPVSGVLLFTLRFCPTCATLFKYLLNIQSQLTFTIDKMKSHLLSSEGVQEKQREGPSWQKQHILFTPEDFDSVIRHVLQSCVLETVGVPVEMVQILVPTITTTKSNNCNQNSNEGLISVPTTHFGHLVSSGSNGISNNNNNTKKGTRKRKSSDVRVVHKDQVPIVPLPQEDEDYIPPSTQISSSSAKVALPSPKLIKCPSCKAKFLSELPLLGHLSLAHDTLIQNLKGKWHCERVECVKKKGLPSPELLKWHMRNHAEMDTALVTAGRTLLTCTHGCSDSGFELRDESELIQHYMNHHVRKSISQYYPEDDEETPPRPPPEEFSLLSHLEKTHGMGYDRFYGPWKCEWPGCGSALPRREVLEWHFKNHEILENVGYLLCPDKDKEMHTSESSLLSHYLESHLKKKKREVAGGGGDCLQFGCTMRSGVVYENIQTLEEEEDKPDVSMSLLHPHVEVKTEGDGEEEGSPSGGSKRRGRPRKEAKVKEEEELENIIHIKTEPGMEFEDVECL